MSKTYEAKWSRIGNSSGYRIQAEFFKENPRFTECGALIEVVDDDTVLLRRAPTNDDGQQEDEVMLASFLNFMFNDGLNSKSFVEYTEEDSALDDELMEGVVLDED